MLSWLSDENFVIDLYQRLNASSLQDSKMDETLFIAKEINRLMLDLKNLDNNSPEYKKLWERTATAINLMLIYSQNSN